MSGEVHLREEIVKLLRLHQEQITSFDRETVERRNRLSHRHFKKLESISETAGFIGKALQVRRQHLQMQRYQVRLQQKRIALILEQAAQLKALKVRWKQAQLEG